MSLVGQDSGAHTFGRSFIKGVVIDKKSNEPLPYANVVIQRINRGGITNEMGLFSLSLEGVMPNDSIGFLYLGYKTKYLSISEVLNEGKIYLNPSIQDLQQVTVFGKIPKARDIVRKVIENKAENYISETNKSQFFIRSVYTSEITGIDLDYKKGSIPGLNDKLIDRLTKEIPRYSTSYNDVLGNLYYIDDSSVEKYNKLDVIKAVSLKEKDISSLNEMENAFDKAMTDTKSDEYWKFRTGIIGFKMDMDTGSGSTVTIDTSSIDESDKGFKSSESMLRTIKKPIKYGSLDSEKDWDFLYNTGKYRYVLSGQTSLGEESVFVIDFTP